jgi:RNA exonuclease 1
MDISEEDNMELIRVTAVDYFSGDVLIDRLVLPTVRMVDYNTRFSGVRRSDMGKARKNRTCIFGRDMARKAVWKFVGPETVVIGRSVNNDLKALWWIHSTVVDSYVLEKAFHDAEEKTSILNESANGAGKNDLLEKAVCTRGSYIYARP